MYLNLYNLVKADFLLFKLVDSFFDHCVDSVNALLDDKGLVLDLKLVVVLLDLSQDLWIDLKSLGMLSGVQRLLVIRDLVSNVLTHIEEVASTFVPIATKSFFHDNVFAFHGDSMIVELPPNFLVSVIEVGVIMTVFCEAIVDHNCV